MSGKIDSKRHVVGVDSIESFSFNVNGLLYGIGDGDASGQA
jgi:hypothetical protein